MIAFVFAVVYQDRAASVSGVPGALLGKADERKLRPAPEDVPIRVWVGEQDNFTWRRTMEAAARGRS